jgi:hypothetical protein
MRSHQQNVQTFAKQVRKKKYSHYYPAQSRLLNSSCVRLRTNDDMNPSGGWMSLTGFLPAPEPFKVDETDANGLRARECGNEAAR